MKYLLLLALLLVPLSCGGDRETPEKTPEQIKKEEVIKSLEAVKPEATIEQKKDEVTRLRGQIALLEAQIKEKQQQETATKALWIGRVAGILAIVALVASFFLISTPILGAVLRQCSLVLAGVSVLSFLVVHLVPYLFLTGCVVAVIILGITIYSWTRDKSVLKKIVMNVEETKTEISDYKKKFRKRLNDADNKLIDYVKKKT